MENADNNFGYLINKCSKLMKYKFNESLKSYDLTSVQWAVLKDLSMQEDLISDIKDSSPASIAKRLYIDRPTLSGIIDRLSKKGLLLSNINPKDRRSQIITLTDKSRSLMLDLEKLGDDVIELAFINFEVTEISTLKTFLQNIIKNLQ